jgi:3-phosphoglycerate kinase
MFTLKEGDFKNKITLVRCDFNVGVDDKGAIADDFRVRAAMPTIRYLQEQQAVVVLMSHLEKKDSLMSLKIVGQRLETLLGIPVKFINDCVGSAAAAQIRQLKPGQVALLENLRFHKEEKANDDNFARSLAALGQVYVNEAFSCAHRAHASIVGVPKYLPNYAGLELESEVASLSKILKNPQHPFVVIMGGSKVSTKTKTIVNITKIADHVLFGSKIGEAILIQKQMLLGRPSRDKDESIEQMDLTSSKIHLPVDGVLALADLSEGYLRKAAIGSMRSEEEIFDIGPETVKFFKEIIKDAKTIFFNGPLGMFENKEFVAGTREILDAVSKNHGAYKVAGGGETLEIIDELGMQNGFDFLSTGGGAMLEFLAGDELPGIKALN